MKLSNLIKEFENQISPDGCNCTICKRGRYEKGLLNRLSITTPPELMEELKVYLEWYYEALAAAETEIEYRNYLEAESKK